MNNNEKIKVYSSEYKKFPNDDEKGFISIDKNNLKNLFEFANFKKEKTKQDLIYIQKISKNIVKEIFEIFPPEKLYICAKLLNFPEKIYKDEINKDNPKIYFENYNYVSMNFSGTNAYMDNLKLKGREIYQSNSFRNEIIGQEIAFNLGKLVYFLLNGVQYSTNSQMYKKNNPRVFQNFFNLTLKNFTIIKSPNDIKLIDFISFNSKQIEKILSKDVINESSDISSDMMGWNFNNFCENKEKSNEIMFHFYFGKGCVENCFSIIPYKKRKNYENNFEINEKTMNDIMEELNKKVDDISINYLEKNNIFNNNIE